MGKYGKVCAFRLRETDLDRLDVIAAKYKCKTFSECIRLLIKREADRIMTDQNQTERKLTSW